MRKAYALLIAAEMKQGRHDRALAACLEGRKQLPGDVELRFRQGVLLDTLGRFAEARDADLSVLSGHEERHLSSVDRGLTGFKVRDNLAVVATRMGDLAEAKRQWKEVVRESPRYRQGWRGLGETLIQEQKLPEAEKLAAELMKDEALCAEGLSRAVWRRRKTALTMHVRCSSERVRNFRATWRCCASDASSFSIMARPRRREQRSGADRPRCDVCRCAPQPGDASHAVPAPR